VPECSPSAPDRFRSCQILILQQGIQGSIRQHLASEMSCQSMRPTPMQITTGNCFNSYISLPDPNVATDSLLHAEAQTGAPDCTLIQISL